MVSQATLNEYKSRKYRDPDWLERQYWDEKRSATEIAEGCGVATSTIYRAMRRFGIPRRGYSEANQIAFNREDAPGFHEGRDHPLWQEHATYHIEGGRSLDGRYPLWGSWYKNECHQVRVHRLLAVAEYGFEAVAGSVVHHKNGLKWDNRSENLELTDPVKHGKMR